LNSGVPVTTFKVGIFLPLGGKTGFFHGKTVLAKINFSGKGLFSPIGKKLLQKLFFQLETSIFHCFTVFRCPAMAKSQP